MSLYEKATLVQIPSGYKAADAKLYSVVPNTTAGDFTVSSVADATRVNKDGLVETTAANQARLNYDFSNPQDPHLLLEPTRTNNLLRSEEFDNSAWTKFSAGTGTTPVVTANYTTSPDGSNNADRVIFDKGSGTGGSDLSQMRQVVTDVGQGISSVYIKSNTSESYTMGIDPVGNATLITVTPEWQRFTYSETTNDRLAIGLRGSQTSNYADVSVWGAQMEAGSYATSLIPTAGSAVTRTVDYASGAGNESLFNDSEGTLFIEAAALGNDGTYRVINISDGDTDNRVLIQLGNNNNQIRADLVSGGITQTALSTTSYNFTNYNKIALKYKDNDTALFVNGTQVGTTQTGKTMPTGLDRIDFQNGDLGGAFYFRGKLKQLMYFDTALTNAELITLTT